MSSKSKRLTAIKQIEKKLLKSFKSKKAKLDKWGDFEKFTGSINGKHGLVSPFGYQLNVRNLFKGIIWIGKVRQIGFTELLLWECIYRAVSIPFFTGVIFCRSGEDVSLLTRRARVVLFSLQIKTVTDSLLIIELLNGSKIIFKNCSQLGTRSIPAVDFLVFDEAAFVRHMDIIYRASLPSTTSAKDPVIMVVSTPQHGSWYNSVMMANNPTDIDVIETSDKLVSGEIPGGLFHWKDNDNITKILLSHRCHPDYGKFDDYVGHRAKIEGISYDEAKQEYGLGWDCGKTQSVFTSESIKQCAVLDELEAYPSELDEMNEIYIAGLDCSSTGDDYTVLSIWRWNQSDDILSLAHLYRQRKKSAEYHLFNIVQLLEKVSCILAIEINSIGQLYFEQLSSQLLDANIVPIRTTAQSKPVMIGKLQLRLESQRILLPEKSPIVSELLNFQRQGEKLTAPSGQHDDCVMSTAIAVMGVDKIR